MGGLLAARVLADYFDRVTIVERDRFPGVGEHRRGVPQARHTHGLLASGANLLEELLPALTRELLDAGALTGDIVLQARWFHAGGYLRQVRSGLDALALSRPLLEGMVRKRVLALDRVRTMENCEAAGLTASPDGRRVTGLILKDGRTLDAGLVVNASGRGSHGTEWLEALGYPKPLSERVEVALGYTTRLFRRRGGELGGDIAAVIPPTPHGKKGGVLLAQEDGRWTATLIAHFGNYAPADLAGFREFARTLPAPDIYEVVRSTEPVGDAHTARFPASLRQRYERLKRFPDGYLVFGDAICSFNPIYGQGMSVAALQATALRKSLDQGHGDLAKTFFGEAAKVVDIPWSIAAGNDLRMPETVGRRTAGSRLINWYITKLHKAAHQDVEVSLAFHKVANLLAPLPSLMSPQMMWRVFRQPGGAGFSPRGTAVPQTVS